MKKFFIAVAVSLLAICFSDEFNGFVGLKWGESKKVCNKTMREQGWRYQATFKDYTSFVGKTYGGKETEFVTLFFEDGVLDSVMVVFWNRSDADSVLEALIKKYGLIETVKKEHKFETEDSTTLFSKAYKGERGVVFMFDNAALSKRAERNKVDESDL